MRTKVTKFVLSFKSCENLGFLFLLLLSPSLPPDPRKPHTTACTCSRAPLAISLLRFEKFLILYESLVRTSSTSILLSCFPRQAWPRSRSLYVSLSLGKTGEEEKPIAVERSHAHTCLTTKIRSSLL